MTAAKTKPLLPNQKVTKRVKGIKSKAQLTRNAKRFYNHPDCYSRLLTPLNMQYPDPDCPNQAHLRCSIDLSGTPHGRLSECSSLRWIA